MPSWCVCCSLYQSFLLILLMISLEKICSITNSVQHQILKADLGQDITMTCFFDPDKLDQVSFMRQTTGDILSVGLELFLNEFSSATHLELKSISTNRLDLKIISVNQNDSGIYTCMLNDEKLTSFHLEILVPPQLISYSPNEASISYLKGSSMNLSCHGFGIPSSNVTWIFKDINKQSKVIHNEEKVYISSIDETDSGLYECIISNGYHSSISRSFYVTVQYSPRIILSTDRIESYVHDTVNLTCQICSFPQLIHVNWFRNDQYLNDINIITKTEFFDDSQCSISTIEIVDISPYQFGRYECQAENNLGKNSSFIDVERKDFSNLKLKQNEINRNGRTALLIDHEQNLNLTLSNKSIRFFSSSHFQIIFSIFIVKFFSTKI